MVKVEVLAGDRWKVTVKDLQTNTEEEFDYDAMIICNGCNFKMSMPDIPGMSDFKGKAIHSKIYRVPEPFTGMKVLIVGGGPSGCDIGTKLLDVAEKVLIFSSYFIDCYKKTSTLYLFYIEFTELYF